MRIAYIDCFSGISGDMIIGALIDAGLPFEQIKNELQKLTVRDEFELSVHTVQKHSITATKFDVHIKHLHPHGHDSKHHAHRHLSDIETIIGESGISDGCKTSILKIFRRLAEAEAKIHNTTIDKVHLHEVGAIDSIVDISGAVIGFHLLNIGRIYSSPVPLGRGTVQCEHGVIPVPGPAVAELLKNYPVEYNDINSEICTPTGAAVLSTLSAGVRPHLKMKTLSIGYGAGTKEFKQLPNLLRISIGEELSAWDQDEIWIIETNIDDMNPEFYPFLMEQLEQSGATDAYLTPTIMKKGRPGILLTVMTLEERIDALLSLIYQQTTTLGVRTYPVRRKKLPRTIIEIETPLGKMKAKQVEINGSKKINPEFEECKRIALEKNIPIQDVYDMILHMKN
jgi:pyridinium-3,5-bisthiocarboxylic acid mononucleotide nickel chelatase